MTLEREDVTSPIIGAAIEVHRALGRGLAEIAYRRALALELRFRDLDVSEEWSVQVKYRGVVVATQRLDLVVTGASHVVVEVKHCDPADRSRLELARSQCATYLAAAEFRFGLVLNFGGPVLVPSRVLNPNLRR